MERFLGWITATMLIVILSIGAPKSLDGIFNDSANESIALNETGEAGSASAAVVSEPFLGQIIMFAGTFAPNGWAKCDGQLLPISQHTALFSILGTTYGGDGEVTFALPDLRGRVPIHAGNGPGLPNHPLGQKSGNDVTTLSVANLPVHNHPISPAAMMGGGDETNPPGGYLSSATEDLYSDSHTATMGEYPSGNTGSGQSFSNMPPYNTVNYIIALVGIYPSF